MTRIFIIFYHIDHFIRILQYIVLEKLQAIKHLLLCSGKQQIINHLKCKICKYKCHEESYGKYLFSANNTTIKSCLLVIIIIIIIIIVVITVVMPVILRTLNTGIFANRKRQKIHFQHCLH